MSETTERIPRFCGKCGTRTNPEEAFCGACGNSLSEAAEKSHPSPNTPGPLAEATEEYRTPPRPSGPSGGDGLSARPGGSSARDVLTGILGGLSKGLLLSVVCAAVLVAGIYVLLLARGVFSDPAVPRNIGLTVFALMHGGALSLDVPQTPELLGLGGSAKLGLPISSFVLFPFVLALLAGRLLARRTRGAWAFVLSAAISYSAFAALISILGSASVDADGTAIQFAADPLSTAARGFLWIGLAAMISAAAASGPLLPARARQVMRGAFVAGCVGILLTVAMSLVVALAQGDAAQGVSGGSTSEILSGVGALFALLPPALGNLWLLAHGLPVGLHGAPDLGALPFVGERLTDVPLNFSLLGEWPFGDAWRFLLIGPLFGIFVGGTVAAGGASGKWRVLQGASVAVPYTVVAALVAILVGVSAEASVAGESVDLAFRASLIWMPLLFVFAAFLGGLGGLLAGSWLRFAPRPNLAFAATAALGVVILLGTLPLFAAAPVPQNPLSTDPTASETPEGNSPETSSIPADSPPDPAFDELLPTLRERTTAPIMLPADLPTELQNVVINENFTDGDKYGVFFLEESTGNVVEVFDLDNVVGFILSVSEGDDVFLYPQEDFEETNSETVMLPDGTEATLRYVEPTAEAPEEDRDFGPHWKGEFEKDGYTYFLSSRFPSEDIARQALASMVEVPNEGGDIAETDDTDETGGTFESGDPSGNDETSGDGETASEESDPSSEEAAIEEAIFAHYEAIGANDFAEAYSYFGPTFRGSNDESTWISSEESYDITDSTVESVEVLSVSDDTATAAVDVSFADDTGTPSFSLVWELVEEDGMWKLDSVSEA